MTSPHQTILAQLVHEMGAVLKFQRHRLGLTQEEVAARVGISAGHLSQVEAGKKIPSLELLVNLTLCLKITMQSLINAATILTEDQGTRAKVEIVNVVDGGFAKALRILGND